MDNINNLNVNGIGTNRPKSNSISGLKAPLPSTIVKPISSSTSSNVVGITPTTPGNTGSLITPSSGGKLNVYSTLEGAKKQLMTPTTTSSSVTKKRSSSLSGGTGSTPSTPLSTSQLSSSSGIPSRTIPGTPSINNVNSKSSLSSSMQGNSNNSSRSSSPSPALSSSSFTSTTSTTTTNLSSSLSSSTGFKRSPSPLMEYSSQDSDNIIESFNLLKDDTSKNNNNNNNKNKEETSTTSTTSSASSTPITTSSSSFTQFKPKLFVTKQQQMLVIPPLSLSQQQQQLISTNNSSHSTPSHSPSPPPPQIIEPLIKTIASNSSASVNNRSRSPSPSPVKLQQHHLHNILDRQVYDILNPIEENLKVYCRFRPESHNEQILSSEVSTTNGSRLNISDDGRSVQIMSGNSPQTFRFSSVFPVGTFQDRIYQTAVKPLVEGALAGYNAAVIAYGTPGSGKTYTMSGYRMDELYETPASSLAPEDRGRDDLWGIIPRVLRDLLMAGVNVKVSMFDVVEKIRDLLLHSSGKNMTTTPLRLIGDGASGFEVVDAIQIPLSLTSLAGFMDLYASASKACSGHMVLAATVTRTTTNNTTGEAVEESSLFYMVDLSASESVSQTQLQGQRLEEQKNINKSLYALGGVIEGLAKKSKHVPYRDSKLTQLLQNCLGGNSKTCIIANCSSCVHESVMRDTLSTLNFGERSQTIRNHPALVTTADMTPQQLRSIIQTLKNELAGLKSVIDNAGGMGLSGNQISAHLLKLQYQLEESKRGESRLQESMTTMESESRESQRMLDNVKELFATKEKDINVMRNEMAEMALKLQYTQTQYAESSNLISLKNTRLAELEKVSLTIDEWKIKYTSAQQQLSNNTQYIQSLENQKSKWKNKCNDLTTQIKSLKDQLQEGASTTNNPDGASADPHICAMHSSMITELERQVEGWQMKCEAMEIKLTGYRESEANLQGALTKLKDQQRQQTDILVLLQRHMETLRERMEIEFPAIANIVNNSLYQSNNSSFSSSTNNNGGEHEESALILMTMRKVDNLFEKISEQQQEQTSNIQSFLTTIDTTIKDNNNIQLNNNNKSIKEYQDQLDQVNRLLENGKLDSSSNGSVDSVPSIKQSSPSLFKSIFINLILFILVILFVFILMVCVGTTIQSQGYKRRWNGIS